MDAPNINVHGHHDRVVGGFSNGQKIMANCDYGYSDPDENDDKFTGTFVIVYLLIQAALLIYFFFGGRIDWPCQRYTSGAEIIDDCEGQDR
jgi:hypothetical protein